MKVRTAVKAGGQCGGGCGSGTQQTNALGGLINVLNGQSNNSGSQLVNVVL